jgi:predicted TPR repeat methyltransferase
MKWVFALLAVVFGIGFVAFGVGAGGTGIGDAISDFLGGGSSDIPSIEDAQKAVAQNPSDPQAFRDLANAYLAAHQNENAADALEKYTKLRPNDESTLRELAALRQGVADAAYQEADQLRRQSSSDFASTLYLVPGSSGFLSAVGGNRIDQALLNAASTKADEADAKAKALYTDVIPVYERLAKLVPSDATVYIQLGAVAERAGNQEKAIAAYQHYLDQDPTGEYAQIVNERLVTLGVASPDTTAPAGTTGQTTTGDTFQD